MYQLSDEILSFYRQTQESKRLTTQTKGQLEFVRTQEIIKRYLPPPPAVVLDIGGGSGPYASWLAKTGYEVHLVDPVDLHIEQAKEASSQQAEHPDRQHIAWRCTGTPFFIYVSGCCPVIGTALSSR